MRGAKVAYRYAKSLLGLAVEQNMLEQAYADMEKIAAVCHANREFRVFLKSPVVKADKKISVIQSVFGNQLSPIVGGFVKIIATHRREDVLAEIADSFVAQYKEFKKISTAEITTAFKMDEKLKENIRQVIMKSEGREVTITEKIDPSLIGGIKVRINDRLFDASISRKLAELKKEFSNKDYVSKL